MLPARSRLRDRTLLASTVKRGNRAGRRLIVIHYLPAPAGADQAPRVGFAVSKAVGGSVVRHRVARRLRHVIASHLDALPAGCTVVVRALPPAADASSAQLDGDVSALLKRLVAA